MDFVFVLCCRFQMVHHHTWDLGNPTYKYYTCCTPYTGPHSSIHLFIPHNFKCWHQVLNSAPRYICITGNCPFQTIFGPSKIVETFCTLLIQNRDLGSTRAHTQNVSSTIELLTNSTKIKQKNPMMKLPTRTFLYSLIL